MANNKRIQILRGTKDAIEKHKQDDLLDGQLLYNKDTSELKIGQGKSIGESKGIGVSRLISDKANSDVSLLDDTVNVTGNIESTVNESNNDWVYYNFNSSFEDGSHIWTDGTNNYYWDYDTNYMYKWSGVKTWTKDHEVTFTGTTLNMWTDGVNTYYTNGGTSYKFITQGSAEHSWMGTTFVDLSPLSGNYIWNTTKKEDNKTNTYYSNGSDQYKFDIEHNTWVEQTWTGISTSDLNGSCVWTDGENYYCNKYKLEDEDSGKWVECDTGLKDSELSQAYNIWNANGETFYSNNYRQLKFDKTNKKFKSIEWQGNLMWPNGQNIWKEASGYQSIYHISSGKQYRLEPVNYNIGTSTNLWHIVNSEGVNTKELKANIIEGDLNGTTDFTNAKWKELKEGTELELDAVYQFSTYAKYSNYLETNFATENLIHFRRQVSDYHTSELFLSIFTTNTLSGSQIIRDYVIENLILTITSKGKVSVCKIQGKSFISITDDKTLNIHVSNIDPTEFNILYRKIR